MSIRLFLTILVVLVLIALASARPHINNGREAVKHSIPWIAAIISHGDATHSGLHECGASLLRAIPDQEKSDIIMTAAHCVENITDFTVCLGAHYSDDVIQGEKCIFAQAIKSRIHPEYKGCEENNTCEHDIALVLLDHPVEFSETIKPIDLPKDYQNAPLPVRTKVIAAGWGYFSDLEQQPSSTLQEAHMLIVHDDVCLWHYGESFIPNAMICAGDPIDGQNTCAADSGGPLFYQNDDGKAILYGITSYGDDCENKVPGVYVKVASYLDWIESTIDEMNEVEKSEGVDNEAEKEEDYDY